VAYKAQRSSDLPTNLAVQDLAGNDAAAFAAKSVSNISDLTSRYYLDVEGIGRIAGGKSYSNDSDIVQNIKRLNYDGSFDQPSNTSTSFSMRLGKELITGELTASDSNGSGAQRNVGDVPSDIRTGLLESTPSQQALLVDPLINSPDGDLQSKASIIAESTTHYLSELGQSTEPPAAYILNASGIPEFGALDALAVLNHQVIQ